MAPGLIPYVLRTEFLMSVFISTHFASQTNSMARASRPHPWPRFLLCREAEAGGFWAYIAGTAYRIATEHIVGGLQLDNHLTTLPLKKGLSSSAAICVMVNPPPFLAP